MDVTPTMQVRFSSIKNSYMSKAQTEEESGAILPHKLATSNKTSNSSWKNVQLLIM